MTVIVLPHEVSETLQILSHLVALDLFFNLMLGVKIVLAVSMIQESVLCQFSELYGVSLNY